MNVIDNSDEATKYIISRLDNIVEEAKTFTTSIKFHHVVRQVVDNMKNDESLIQYILKSTYLTTFDEFKLKFQDDTYRHIKMEGIIPCKGKGNRKLCYHQIVLGANTYAKEFFDKHGYSREVAEVKACLLWNYLNKVEYFKTLKLKTLLDRLEEQQLCQENKEQLTQMHRLYRKYYDSADHDIMLGEKKIEGTKDNPKPRPITFWNIFNPMYKEVYLNDTSPTLNESKRENRLVEMMRAWNDDHGKKYFKV